MEISAKWLQIVACFCILLWTISNVSGQKYYINLYGLNPYEGTIEISDGLSWYILHPQGWNDRNAAVACRMFGYSGDAAKASLDSMLPVLSRPIWDLQFNCKGNEPSLSDCNTTKLTSTTSNVSVGVHCPSNPAPPEYDSFLLRKMSDNRISKTNIITMSGVIDMRTTCFSDIEGEVVYDPKYDQIVYLKNSAVWGCRFGKTKVILHSFASGVGVYLPAFDTEDRLLFYISDGRISKLNLDEVTATPVVVVSNATYIDLIALDIVNKEIYWVNSYTHSIERARYNGTSRAYVTWTSRGAVIDFVFSGDNVFWKDSRVPGITKTPVNNSTRWDTIYPGVSLCLALYLIGERMYCTITREAILRLERNGKCGEYYGPSLESSGQIVQYYDSKNSDMEPKCQNLYINLFGPKPNEGIVEISNGIDWHILCDDGWDDNAAAVACRMLGHPGKGASSNFNASIVGQTGAMYVWPYQFHCKGDERKLTECNITFYSSVNCKRAGLRCSEQKDVQDFFLKRTAKGLSKTNPFTMCGYVSSGNNSCDDLPTSDMVYDSVYDQFLYFRSESLWGCKFGDLKTAIRANISVLSYPAIDPEDRLLFGYLDNDIVSLELDNTSSELVIVVRGTSVGTRLVLDTERNEIYWWSGDSHKIIKRVSYQGDTEVDVFKTSTDFITFVFNGGYLFSLDNRGVTRIHVHQNTTESELLYKGADLGKRCSMLYADKNWIYCNNILGILRFQTDGKWGSFHGPFDYLYRVRNIIYHHSPASSGKTSDTNLSSTRIKITNQKCI